jgi:NAD(P)-dependent dehydrogenase (short-subunit alcohol dehydrogenase family)
MADRAAIVTGASSGIGLAITRMLAAEGYGVTMAARRPDKLQGAFSELEAEGHDVQQVAGDLGAEETVQQVVAAHRDRYGRLDVLANNAGVGIGAAVGEIVTKRLDIQLNTNLRSPILFYRECTEMLKASGAEHRRALVVNTASIAGVHGQAWLSVYGATKAALLNFTYAMNKELAAEGVKSTALCPGFVDTPMTDFVKGQVPAEEMMRPEDMAEAVRFLLKVSPACIVPEIQFVRPGDGL